MKTMIAKYNGTCSACGEANMTSEIALRRIRQRIFDYPAEKQAQADRVLRYLKSRNLRYQVGTAQRGPYSGLTRAEMPCWLCEPDFF